MKKVTPGKVYHFLPVSWDLFRPCTPAPCAGDYVRVINLPGAPRANYAGHCYVQDIDGKFAGLVLVASLQPAPAKVRKQWDRKPGWYGR